MKPKKPIMTRRPLTFATEPLRPEMVRARLKYLRLKDNDNYFESKKGSVPFDQLLLVV